MCVCVCVCACLCSVRCVDVVASRSLSFLLRARRAHSCDAGALLRRAIDCRERATATVVSHVRQHWSRGFAVQHSYVGRHAEASACELSARARRLASRSTVCALARRAQALIVVANVWPVTEMRFFVVFRKWHRFKKRKIPVLVAIRARPTALAARVDGRLDVLGPELRVRIAARRVAASPDERARRSVVSFDTTTGEARRRLVAANAAVSRQ